MHGTITTLKLERDFGFIDPTGPGNSLWFHRERLAPDLEWNEQLQYQRVEFDTYHGPRGPVAENIRAAE